MMDFSFGDDVYLFRLIGVAPVCGLHHASSTGAAPGLGRFLTTPFAEYARSERWRSTACVHFTITSCTTSSSSSPSRAGLLITGDDISVSLRVLLRSCFI